MTRIRSVKPGYWTDEAVMDASPLARLLFIGLWNIADDDGLLADKPREIKIQLFPADAIDLDPVLDELVALRMLEAWETAEGRRMLAVRNFRQHQKPQHPTPSKIDMRGAKRHPTRAFTSSHEDSGVFTQERRGEELRGEEPRESRAFASSHERSGNRAELLDQLFTVCGIRPLDVTDSAGRSYDKAVSDLMRLGATPDDVIERSMAFRDLWPNASLTPAALVRRWAECVNPSERALSEFVAAQ